MKALRYRIEYAFTLGFAWLLQRLSLEQARLLGRIFGRLAYVLGVARKIAHENLRDHLGVQDAKRRREIALEAYEGFAQTMIEIARMPVTDPADFDRRFEFQGLELLEQARAEGKGTVCMSGHYGNWEWMGAALVRRGFEITFLIGTQSNPHVDRLFNEYRATLGMQFVRIRSIKDALRALKQNRLVAIVGDQDGDKYGAFVPFFGVDASTHSIGTLLARKAGAAICYGVPQRLENGNFRVAVQRLPEAPASMSEAQATAFLLNDYNQRLEADVRAHPGQWLWMHKRWRSKPVHRLAGEERARAERGELIFDWKEVAWRDAKSGELVALETWK